jgi:hypothetical protein
LLPLTVILALPPSMVSPALSAMVNCETSVMVCPEREGSKLIVSSPALAFSITYRLTQGAFSGIGCVGTEKGAACAGRQAPPPLVTLAARAAIRSAAHTFRFLTALMPIFPSR